MERRMEREEWREKNQDVRVIDLQGIRIALDNLLRLCRIHDKRRYEIMHFSFAFLIFALNPGS